MAAAPLNGSIVAVTGAASGIGRACAGLFAQEGATVVLLDRDAEGAAAAARELTGFPVQALGCDVSDSTGVATALAAVEKQHGRIDVLVNCAGINTTDRHFARTSPADWDRLISVNLSGMFYACHAVMEGMRGRGAGTIINFASWAGRHAAYFPGVAYTASKRAVLALTESINIEEGLHGIRATAIVPEEVATAIVDQRPVPPTPQERARMLTPEDVARCVLFAASLPARACINELVVSPTWNRDYLGLHRTALTPRS
jgi:NAD(P)-dependent dehydrogenase (short-subunit alcohol dehydrogenase family)